MQFRVSLLHACKLVKREGKEEGKEGGRVLCSSERMLKEKGVRRE